MATVVLVLQRGINPSHMAQYIRQAKLYKPSYIVCVHMAKRATWILTLYDGYA